MVCTSECAAIAFGTRNGITNEKGEVCGFIPSNETLGLVIYNSDTCSEMPLLYSQIIGPFNSDSNISIVLPPNPEIFSETIVGTVNNCDDQPVNDGYVILSHDNQDFFSLITEGAFEVNLLRCSSTSDTFNLYGVNSDAIETTDNISYTFTTPLTNIGTINTCNVQEELIQYIIDGEIVMGFTDNIEVSFGTESFIIKREIENNTAKFLLIAPSYVGNYTTSTTSSSLLNFAILENNQYDYIFASQYGISINVISLGNAIGEYIEISFSGTFEQDGVTRTIEGTATVIRDN